MNFAFGKEKTSSSDFTENTVKKWWLHKRVTMGLQNVFCRLHAVQNYDFSVSRVEESDERRVGPLFHP
jgi:hypothetical protein